jgi:hypothetical protein
MKVGKAPVLLGRLYIPTPEMMFVQYMPIHIPGVGAAVPPHLRTFVPLIEMAMREKKRDQYVYLTAKRLYVEKDHCFNRPGWHTDGFGTDDINYVWADRGPTEFCVQPFDLSEDCDESMAQMEAQARPESIQTYGPQMALRLDSAVVHRPPQSIATGYRTFAKVSISRDLYNLEGNAHNYLLDYDWQMVPRREARNHPAQVPA